MRYYLLLLVTCGLCYGCKKEASDPPVSYQTHVLPLVFHELYGDDHPVELPDMYYTTVVDHMNDFFNARASYRSSVDMNIEFTMATHSPEGVRLPSPGIHRVYYEGIEEMTGYDFINSPPTLPQNQGIFWDPNQYINIWIFEGAVGSPGGIAYLPYTTREHRLMGLATNGEYYFNHPMTQYMQGIAICSRDVLYGAVVHEMGHYLGLLHPFVEGPCNGSDDYYDDYCSDTPKYSYPDYVKNMMFLNDKRTSCSGKTFSSTNFMDYGIGTMDRMTPQQAARIRNVLSYSPLIPRDEKASALLLQRMQTEYTETIPIGLVVE